MPSDSSFLLRTTIELHLTSLRRALSTFAPALPGTVENFALLAGRMDPEFLEALARIDTDEALTLIGKQRAALAAGREAATYVDRFRKEHLGGLDTRIAQEQRTIDAAIAAEARREKVGASPEQVEAMRLQLAGLDPLQITNLYLSAPPQMQILIEAVADLTGGKILLRGGTPRWVDMLNPAHREQVVRQRNATAAPEATARLEELKLIRNVYDIVTSTADKLVEGELAKRGALNTATQRFIDAATGAQLVPNRGALASS